MKAAVFHKPDDIRYDTMPDTRIELVTDIILKVTSTAEVKRLKKCDRVVVPFPIACGHCFFYTHGASPACENSNYKHYGLTVT